MKIGTDNICVKMKAMHSYNCAMCTINDMYVEVNGNRVYGVDTKYEKDIKGLSKEFLCWLGVKTGQGVFNTGGYERDQSFFVFHDNVKCAGAGPLEDSSAFMEYLYTHQEELKCLVIRTPMVDNLWHLPNGHHPGRVYVIIPPYVQIYLPNKNVPISHKKSLKYLLSCGYSLCSSDKEVIKEILKV